MKPYYETELGKLFHGDCLDIMPGLGPVDLVLTDPPYEKTQNKWDSIIPLEPMWKCLKRITRPSSGIVITASQPFTSLLILSNKKMFKYCATWHKKRVSNFLNAKKQLLRSTEDIVIFYKKQCVYNPQFSERKHKRDFTTMLMKPHSDNFGKQRNYISTINKDSLAYPTTLIEIRGLVNNEREKVSHPTQKPIALMEYLIKTYSNKNGVVLDFCLGSGTTAIACERLNRRWVGIEISEEYCEIAAKRIEKERQQLKLF